MNLYLLLIQLLNKIASRILWEKIIIYLANLPKGTCLTTKITNTLNTAAKKHQTEIKKSLKYIFETK